MPQLTLFDKSKPKPERKPKALGPRPPTADSDPERRREWLLALVSIDPTLSEPGELERYLRIHGFDADEHGATR